MRPTDIVVAPSGAGGAFSPWTPINYKQLAFGIGLGFSISSGAALTASVQHTFDDTNTNDHPVIVVATGSTTLTVTDQGPYQPPNGVFWNGNHLLSVGDWVQLIGTGLPGADGPYAVASVVSATSYTVTAPAAVAAGTSTLAQAKVARVYNHATLTALAARADGYYAYTPMAIRLNVTAWTSGVASLCIRQGEGP